jgi:hypothetical protein
MTVTSSRGRVIGHNLATSLRGRRQSQPMQAYDRLPVELRVWLAGAALPWSAHSALKLWRRLCRECGSDAGARLRGLDRVEARMLARDAPRIWGASYPLAPQREGGTTAEIALPLS